MTFNGSGTVAVLAGGNVSSITDNGICDYTANFTVAMSDTLYCCVQTNERHGSSGNTLNIPGVKQSTKAVGSVGLYGGRITAGGEIFDTDSPTISVAIFR